MRTAGEAPEGTRELVFDITDVVATTHALAAIETLDAVVANAGIAIAAPLEFLPEQELTRQLDVNVVGQFRVVQPLLPLLRRSRGRVVLMGSIGGRSALPFLGAYAMSKFALEAFADSLRVEVAPWGIHVAIVEPGTIATAMWTKPQRALDEFPPEAAELYGERIERVPQARRRALVEGRPGRGGGEGGRARADLAEAAHPLRRRPRREEARPRPAAPRPAARPRAHTVPVRIVGLRSWATRSARSAELGDGPRLPQGARGARRDGLRRQRDRLPAPLRRAEPLPRHAGRAVLRPPRHGDVHVRRRRARRRAKAGSCTSSRRRTDRSRTAPTTTSSCWSSAARTATSSATATSSTPRSTFPGGKGS